MKVLYVSLILLFASLSISAQNEPVKWSFNLVKNTDQTYTLKATAKMDDEWAIYSQHTGEGGPIPLSFEYKDVSLVEKTKELSTPIKKRSDLFEIEVIKFKKEAIFEQRFTPKKGAKMLSGKLTYMCCDNKRCLPPTEVLFDLAL